mgnify:CR=1 FL=1
MMKNRENQNAKHDEINSDDAIAQPAIPDMNKAIAEPNIADMKATLPPMVDPTIPDRKEAIKRDMKVEIED